MLLGLLLTPAAVVLAVNALTVAALLGTVATNTGLVCPRTAVGTRLAPSSAALGQGEPTLWGRW